MKTKYLPAFILSLLSMTAFGVLQAAEQSTIKRSDGTEIHFYLSDAELPGDVLLVLIQGSDCNSVYRNDRINNEFSQVLPGADVLTVEKYGIDSGLEWSDDPERGDCPDAYIENDSPEQRVMDYTQVIGELRKDREYKQTVLLGGSEGAVVANHLTAELDYIDATVSINGGGRRFIDDVLHSIASQALSDEEYHESSKGFLGFYNHILNSEPFAMNVSGHGYRWWRSMFEIDQTALLSQIDTPVLLVQAGMDKNVSVELAVEQAKILSRDKPNITFRVYEELDHSFEKPDGTSGVEQVIEDIKLWLSRL